MIATYDDIKRRVRQSYGKNVETCHIAHAKELSGIPVKVAWNRHGERKKPCPEQKLPLIQEAFRHFGWDPQTSI